MITNTRTNSKGNEIHLRKEHLFQSIDNFISKCLIPISENQMIQMEIQQRQSLNDLIMFLLSSTLNNIYNALPMINLTSTVLLNLIIPKSQKGPFSFNTFLCNNSSRKTFPEYVQKQLMKIGTNLSITKLQIEKILLKEIRSKTISPIKTNSKHFNHQLTKTHKQIQSNRNNYNPNQMEKIDTKKPRNTTSLIHNQTFNYMSPNSKTNEHHHNQLQFKIEKLHLLKRMLNQMKTK